MMSLMWSGSKVHHLMKISVRKYSVYLAPWEKVVHGLFNSCYFTILQKKFIVYSVTVVDGAITLGTTSYTYTTTTAAVTAISPEISTLNGKFHNYFA